MWSGHEEVGTYSYPRFMLTEQSSIIKQEVYSLWTAVFEALLFTVLPCIPPSPRLQLVQQTLPMGNYYTTVYHGAIRSTTLSTSVQGMCPWHIVHPTIPTKNTLHYCTSVPIGELFGLLLARGLAVWPHYTVLNTGI